MTRLLDRREDERVAALDDVVVDGRDENGLRACSSSACGKPSCALTVAPELAWCVDDGVIEKLTPVGVVSLSRVIVSVLPTTTTS